MVSSYSPPIFRSINSCPISCPMVARIRLFRRDSPFGLLCRGFSDGRPRQGCFRGMQKRLFHWRLPLLFTFCGLRDGFLRQRMVTPPIRHIGCTFTDAGLPIGAVAPAWEAISRHDRSRRCGKPVLRVRNSAEVAIATTAADVSVTRSSSRHGHSAVSRAKVDDRPVER